MLNSIHSTYHINTKSDSKQTIKNNKPNLIEGIKTAVV
jgi:hypothetical protein